MAVYAVVLFRLLYNASFNTLSGWRFDPAPLQASHPKGAELSSIWGLSLFILILGLCDEYRLQCQHHRLHAHASARITVPCLVGQYLGMNDPERAEDSVDRLHLAIVYMGSIALLYLFAPDIFISRTAGD